MCSTDLEKSFATRYSWCLWSERRSVTTILWEQKVLNRRDVVSIEDCTFDVPFMQETKGRNIASNPTLAADFRRRRRTLMKKEASFQDFVSLIHARFHRRMFCVFIEQMHCTFFSGILTRETTKCHILWKSSAKKYNFSINASLQSLSSLTIQEDAD